MPSRTPVPQPATSHRVHASSFPIVGIGASAGGIEACTHLLKHLPGDTGMAFVFVQHLDPTHKSLLSELFARVTPMPVAQIKDGMAVVPNHVYVVPPNANLTIVGNRLKLVSRGTVRTPQMPIDVFFRSLATEHGSQAIGVVLSGTGSDGALGLAEIKEQGGIIFVQDEQTAKFTGMPHSAIEQGAIDSILPPEQIAAELARIARHPYIASPAAILAPEHSASPAEEGALGTILTLLRRMSGVDFSSYKRPTIIRRLTRRMTLRKLEHLEEYAVDLAQHPNELTSLYHDLLIKVTGFFREPESFVALKREVIPALLHHRPAGKPIRVWVPGCATGEEAYSIAIVLLEALGEQVDSTGIQVFATDINELSLAKARSGNYVENIACDITSERLQRFFIKIDQTYRVSKSVRELCTFAKHNLYKDPPFSNLDLISCRNLLIYLEPAIQRQIMPIFHYALNPTGFLTLGASETVGAFTDLFALRDKKHKIYAKRATAVRPHVHVQSRPSTSEGPEHDPHAASRPSVWKEVDVSREAERATLNYCAPAGVLINEQFDILQFRGDTGHYLLPSQGKASLSLLKMAREGLLADLRAALEQAKKTGEPVKRARVRIRYEHTDLETTIHVIPLKQPPPSSHFVVLFEEPGGTITVLKPKGQRPVALGERRQRERLFHEELETTKRALEATVEERDATNEELRSANEEVLSANEELQSTNEELETAKEELQSSNEELTTVNEELLHGNEELSQANNDLNNLFSNADLPIILLDRDLRIRRFTPSTERVLNIIPTDIGRPIHDLQLNVHIPDLKGAALKVMRGDKAVEREVQDREGHWYSLRMQPYKTVEDAVEGVVLRFVDIHSLKDVTRLTNLLTMCKRAEEDAQAAQQYAESIVETIRETSLVILDDELRVKTANRAFYETFGGTPEETEGRPLYELGNRRWDIPHLRQRLQEILPQETLVQAYEVEHAVPGVGRQVLLLNARQLDQPRGQGGVGLILLAIEDITNRKRAEEQITTALHEKEVLLKEVHHRVKNNLQIVSSLLSLQSGYIEDPNVLLMFKESQSRIRSMALVHEQLYQSKSLDRIDAAPYIENLVRSLRRSYAINDSVTVKLNVDAIAFGPNTAVPCALLVNELVANAFEHAFRDRTDGELSLSLHRTNNESVCLTIKDNGVGLPANFEIIETQSLGLRLVTSLVEQLGGTLAIERQPGATFRITFPLVTFTA